MTFFIDSHVHIMPPIRLRGLARWILKSFPDHPVTEDVTANQIITQLRNNGVTHFFNFIYPLSPEETKSLNQFNIRFCSETAGAIPFVSLHQDSPDKIETAEKLLESKEVIGFKFHPFVQKFDPWDKRMLDLYRFLEEAEKPVFFHTGFEMFYQMKMPLKKLEDFLKQFPKLPVVFVHMAFPEFPDVFKLLDDFPNLYLDATNVLSIRRPEFKAMADIFPNGLKLIDWMLEGIEACSDRIMYGSDHPVGMGGLESIYSDLEKLPVSEQVKDSLKFKTAKQFIDRFHPTFDWNNRLS